MIDTYTSLHNHSEFSNALLSFTDSINKIPEMLHWCYDNNLYGMALSEHEGVSGWVELEQEASNLPTDKPFKHIFANEIYLISEKENELIHDKDVKVNYWHFLLIALDEIGVRQIYELSSRAWLRSYMYKGLRRRPTFDSDIKEVIGSNPNHIVGATACLGGELPHIILEGDLDKAIEFVKKWQQVFGKNNFFLECQPCYSDNQEQIQVNQTMLWLHDKTNAPMIVTTDSHYLTKDQRKIHATFLRSKDGGDSREPDKFYATTHFFTPQELRETLYISKFTDEQIDMMFSNTNDIADRVQPIKLKQTTQVPSLPSLPNFTIKHIYKKYYASYPFINYYANSTDPYEQYYYYQIEKGLEALNPVNLETYLAQINIEMEQVKGLGDIFDKQRMCDYFTVVQKIVDLIWSEGDSLVGIGRGSAGAYVTNRLLGITGIDPLLPEVNDFFPWWRFCSVARSESIFDIDIDIQSFKKNDIITAIKKYFGERQVCQVVTWGALSAKTAIERACRGLDIPLDTAAYLRSLVPVKRGQIYSLADCLYGNEEKGREKVKGFKNELNKYPDLLETALAFEGLIISSGVHAGALNVLKSDFTNTGSLMVSSNGAIINQYDLHHGEYCGQLKMDLLSIDALENIRACLDLLISSNHIKWQGSLRETYNHYLSYDALEKDNIEMWKLLPKMTAAFQYDSRAGKEALSKIGATNIVDLTLANGLMRLATPDKEQPMDRYIRYRDNIQEWYNDMTGYGLTQDEQSIYKRLLGKYSGLCISQETMMVMLMDKEVCGFTLKEADRARKAVAKKSAKALQETEELLYKKGQKLGKSQKFLDYLWRVQIEMSKSYAFAFSHSCEYSIECLQELNLYWKYPKVYWNTAVVITQSQTEDERDGSATIKYGKISKSIYKAKENSIDIVPPYINDSNISFTPNEKNNSIIFGLGGIAGINPQISQQIISNRPYSSFKDFYLKNSFPDSLITPTKIKQLIKAGCFDCFEPNRIKVMKQYIVLSTPKPTNLTMQNISTIRQSKVYIPLDVIAPYNFFKYVTDKSRFYCNHPKFKSKKCYWLNERGEKYFKEHIQSSLTYEVDFWTENDRLIVVDKSIEKVIKPSLEALKTYINTEEFKENYYKSILRQKYSDFIDNYEDVNKWSFDACSFFSHEHQLANLKRENYNISLFDELPEEPIFITKVSRGREYKNYEIYRIAGVILDKNDNHHSISLLDINNHVVECKFDQGAYAYYKSQMSEIEGDKKIVMDKPWLARGNAVILTGYRNGADDFIIKTYKSSVFQHKVQIIDRIDNEGNILIRSTRYNNDEKEANNEN